MNCFTHDRSPAVGLCSVCQKGVCPQCVGRDLPRVVCNACLQNSSVMGFEFQSRTRIGSWPLLHVCTGIDPVTMRPRIAKGVVAIGNIALGGVAIGGLACGLVSFGGGSLGLLMALGGAAIGLGLSIGGLAIGSIALGGAAVGFMYAIGGGAVGPAVIDGRRCDPQAFAFVREWLSILGTPPSCR